MFSKKVVIGASLIAIVVLLYMFLLLNGITYQQQVTATKKASLEIIPAGQIPTADTSLLIITPTSTLPAQAEVNGVTIQKFVKIEGTGGVGLRIRRNPGVDAEIVFLANESEVFIVIGGPEEKDGILWWQLTTPYDDSRSGWASADYLVAVAED